MRRREEIANWIKRKKTVLLCGMAAVLAVGAGITMAVLVADTEQRVNVFVRGDIDLELLEEDWDEWDENSGGEEMRKTYPGKVFVKDPAVRIPDKKGSKDTSSAYVFLEVLIPMAEVRTVSDAERGEIEGRDTIPLFSFEAKEYPAESPGWIAVEDPVQSGSYMRYLYGYSDILEPGDTSEKLFETVTYARVVEGDLPKGTKLDILVNAYAIQADYLEGQTGVITEDLKKAFSLYEKEPE